METSLQLLAQHDAQGDAQHTERESICALISFMADNSGSTCPHSNAKDHDDSSDSDEEADDEDDNDGGSDDDNDDNDDGLRLSSAVQGPQFPNSPSAPSPLTRLLLASFHNSEQLPGFSSLCL